MKLTKEIEEFVSLTITEHMGKAYAEWKIKQQSVTEPDKVEEEYEKVIASLSPEQEEAITKYCDAIFSSGADTEEFLSSGTERWIEIKESNKRHIEISFVSKKVI